MKFLNLASLFFSSVVILACSGGDESNPVSNNSRENFVGVKYPLVLDEANQKFSTYEVNRHDVCKVDDDKYEFVTMVDTQHIERKLEVKRLLFTIAMEMLERMVKYLLVAKTGRLRISGKR